MLKEKVKYAKRFTNKVHDYEFSKARIQPRDFGATLMTKGELETGIKRALKRGNRAKDEETRLMYLDQALAYRARVEWYEK
jgi:hypothetical protein